MTDHAIIMKNVSKDFKVLNRHEGLKGSLPEKGGQADFVFSVAGSLDFFSS